MLKGILTGLVGNQLNLMTVLNIPSKDIEKDDQPKYKMYIGNEDLEEKIDDLAEKPFIEDDVLKFIKNLRISYDGLTLKKLLGNNQTLSEAMIERYDNHAEDWELIKNKIRNASNKKEINIYYAALVDKKVSQEETQKQIDKLKKAANYPTNVLNFFSRHINESAEKGDITTQEKTRMLERIEKKEFLKKLRTKENGSIPYQLQLNELQKIIENQQKYYPFLKDTFDFEGEEKNKIAQLLEFRVPYYVGPMVTKEDVEKAGGVSTNHWMQRKEVGQITPWNAHHKIDYQASAAQFIHKVTGTDTYLLGEKTLPKASPLFQKYNVLQELSNARIQVKNSPDSSERRLFPREKQQIFHDLFQKQKDVTKGDVESYLESQYGKEFELSGLAKSTKFTSSLDMYHYLAEPNNLGKEFVDNSEHASILEQIAEVQTVFKDQKLLKSKLYEIEGLSFENAENLSKHRTGGVGCLKNF